MSLEGEATSISSEGHLASRAERLRDNAERGTMLVSLPRSAIVGGYRKAWAEI